MAEPKAGLGSSEPINRSEEELACPSKQSNSAIFNCLEKAEEALIIFYMCVSAIQKPNLYKILKMAILKTSCTKLKKWSLKKWQNLSEKNTAPR